MSNEDFLKQVSKRFECLIDEATSKCKVCQSIWKSEKDQSLLQKAIKYLDSGDIASLEEEIVPEFYEIIVGLALRKLGYEVIHYEHMKRNKNDREKTPDFLVRDNLGNEFFVEVTYAVAINSLDRNVQQLMSILHSIVSDMGEGLVFSMSVDYIPEEDEAKTARDFQKEEKIDKRLRDIIEYIVTDNASQKKFHQFARELFKTTIHKGKASKEWKHSDNKGCLKFSSRLIQNSTKLKNIVILSYVGPSYSYFREAIENKIKYKKKYQQLDKPVVLFIGTPSNITELHYILACLVYGRNYVNSLKDIMKETKAQQCMVVFKSENRKITYPLKGNEYLIHLSNLRLQYKFAGYIIHYFSPVGFLLNPEMSGGFVSIPNPLYEGEHPPVLFDFPIYLFTPYGFETTKNYHKQDMVKEYLKKVGQNVPG